MDDLVAFIEARLRDDEATARAAGADVWEVEHRTDWHAGDGTSPDPDCAAGRCDCSVIEGANGMRIYDEGGHSAQDAAHVSRHDPARVLRDVETARWVLRQHEHHRFPRHPDGWNEADFRENRPAFPDTDWPYVGCGVCDYDYRFEEVYPSTWCGYVRRLASAWSDHPDFRPEWSPTDG